MRWSTKMAEDEFKQYVGQKFQDAVLEIQERYPSHQVHSVRSDMFVTMDYRLDRIRVFYDEETGLVTQAGIG
jgi:hypothetical protein